jgi:hypothetical protein
LKREEKFPLIGLLASSFESFNDSTKLFPNSIILVRQLKKAIEHNVKDGVGKSYKPSKKLIQTKSEREIVDLWKMKSKFFSILIGYYCFSSNHQHQFSQ